MLHKYSRSVDVCNVSPVVWWIFLLYPKTEPCSHLLLPNHWFYMCYIFPFSCPLFAVGQKQPSPSSNKSWSGHLLLLTPGFQQQFPFHLVQTKNGTTHAIHWPSYWFARVLKRSLVMPLPKHTNLLDQVCQNIDWEEVQLAPLCSLQRGSHAVKQDYQRSHRHWKDVHHFLSENTKGVGTGTWLRCRRREEWRKKKKEAGGARRKTLLACKWLALLMYSWPSRRGLITMHARQSIRHCALKCIGLKR